MEFTYFDKDIESFVKKYNIVEVEEPIRIPIKHELGLWTFRNDIHLKRFNKENEYLSGLLKFLRKLEYDGSHSHVDVYNVSFQEGHTARLYGVGSKIGAGVFSNGFYSN